MPKLISRRYRQPLVASMVGRRGLKLFSKLGSENALCESARVFWVPGPLRCGRYCLMRQACHETTVSPPFPTMNLSVLQVQGETSSLIFKANFELG